MNAIIELVTWARPVQVNKMEEDFGTGSELWGPKGECMEWLVKGVGSYFVNHGIVILWQIRALALEIAAYVLIELVIFDELFAL